MRTKLEIRQATEKDLPTIFSLVKSLAEHVNLTHEISASAEDFRECIFGTNGFVEALIGYFEAQPVAMLIFYPSFSKSKIYFSYALHTKRIHQNLN